MLSFPLLGLAQALLQMMRRKRAIEFLRSFSIVSSCSFPSLLPWRRKGIAAGTGNADIFVGNNNLKLKPNTHKQNEKDTEWTTKRENIYATTTTVATTTRTITKPEPPHHLVLRLHLCHPHLIPRCPLRRHCTIRRHLLLLAAEERRRPLFPILLRGRQAGTLHLQV